MKKKNLFIDIIKIKPSLSLVSWSENHEDLRFVDKSVK
ncbi:uncharacterized protein METZ01_LOCUS175493, partial [marine metagenome]